MQRSIGAFDVLRELLPVLAAAVAGAAVFWLIVRLLEPRIRPWAAKHQLALHRAPGIGVGAMVLAYIGALGWLAIVRHLALRSSAYDLGIFSQVLWNTSQGRLFDNTVMIEYSRSLLGQHFSPIFLLLVPLYWVWPDPQALILLQTVALGLGAIPVYLLARRRLANGGLAVMLAAVYLLMPALHYINLYDFHEIALTTPLLLAAVYFLDVRRGWPMVLCLALALLCREEVSIIVVAFGVALLFQRRWKLGFPLIAVGGAYLATTTLWLVPFFQESSVYYFVVRYGKLGNTIPEIITTLVTRPLWVAQYLMTRERLEYLLRLFLPVGLLGPVGLPLFALSLPTFGYLLLSDYHEQYDIVNQYSAPLIPFIMAGTIVAIGWLTKLPLFRGTPARYAIGGYVLFAAFASTVAYGPTPIGVRHDPDSFVISDHARRFSEVLALIPPNASVSAQSGLVPHLTTRRALYMFPNIHNAEYVLVDNWTDRWPLSNPDWDAAIGEMLANTHYKLLWTGDGYGVFKRVDPPPIEHPVSVSFLGKMELVGYDLPKQAAKPGDTIEVGLWWRALTPIGVRRIKDRFVTYLHLLNANNEPLVQVDKEPWNGILKTDRFIQGELHRERYTITIPADAKPGTYHFTTGLYSFYSKRPLAIFDESGQRTAQFVYQLAAIQVTPGTP